MTDLTFDQLKTALVTNSVAVNAIFVNNGKVIIDVGAVLGSNCNSLSQKEVIKFLTKLLDTAIKAQATTNQDKIAGQRLATFSSQITLNSQVATTTFTFRTRHEINSTTNIIGGGIGLPPPIIYPEPIEPEVNIQDPDILDFKNRIVANNGTISDATLAAANEFLIDLKLAGIRSKIIRLNLRCGNQLAAALVPLIKDAGFDVDQATNFTEDRYSESTGLSAVGSPNPYLNTGVNASTCGISNASCSLGMYILNSAPSANQYAFAAADGTNLHLTLMPRFFDYSMFDCLSSGGGRVGAISTETKGFLIGSRISLADSRIYQSGIQLGTTLATSSDNNIANADIYIFRYNFHGNPGEYVSAGDFIGLGLNTSEVANLYNIFQAFNTSLGRQV